MRYLIFSAWLCFFLFLSFTHISCAQEFPYREKYPHLKVVELNDLKSGYDAGNFVIVDLRSETEFEAVHIKNAIHVPYGHAKFTKQLKKVSVDNSSRKIAVYCNGIDCIKSYKAAENALYESIPNIFVFDAGILSWAKAYPTETILMGKAITKPEEQFISEKSINRRKVNVENFMKEASNSNTVLIDARDPIQRISKVPGLENAILVPMDKLVHNIILKGHMKDKKLLIFDQVGRQVDWLIYYLVKNGYEDFYFLKGGATTILKEQIYRVSAL